MTKQNPKNLALAVMAALAAGALIGCAGHEAVRSTPGTPAGVGTVHVTVVWPPAKGVAPAGIPSGTQSIQLRAYQNRQMVASCLVVRPATDGALNNVACGTTWLQADACSNSDGTGTVLASAVVTITVHVGFNDAVGLTLIPSSYAITDLGTLPGGSRSGASSVNASGQVVGASETSGGGTHAFLYSMGTMTDLGTLGGTNSAAGGINASGQVVGDAFTARSAYHAFLYSGGTMADMGTLVPLDQYYSSANGINASGQVVGDSTVYVLGWHTHAFLYLGGTMAMADLGTLPGGTDSYASGINASGQVVGGSGVAGGATHAFLYSGGTMTDLGTLPGGTESEATGINDSGQVVGSSGPSFDEEHAFLYSGGTMADLGTLPGGTTSQAYGINASGQVVGWSDNSSGAHHSFLYSGGTMIDLGTLPGASSTSASAINDLGQVVGYCDFSDGSEHAVLWQPLAGASAARAGAETSAGTAAASPRKVGRVVPRQRLR